MSHADKRCEPSRSFSGFPQDGHNEGAFVRASYNRGGFVSKTSSLYIAQGLILGQTGEHNAGGILDRTSLPLVQHRPTRRTDIPGAGTVQHAAELDTGEAPRRSTPFVQRDTLRTVLATSGIWTFGPRIQNSSPVRLSTQIDCWNHASVNSFGPPRTSSLGP